MKAVVAVGGATALSACLDRTGGSTVPTGVSDLSSLPTGQHHWNAHLSRDEHENVENARHHVLRFLDYPGDEPSDADRETVEAALRTLERAYAWSNEGVLFTLGYSPAYFRRFDEGPAGVDLPPPAPLADFEDPELERYDAVLHLASDNADALVEAEEAMLGDRADANGDAVEARLSDVFEAEDTYPARRTGFVGGGLPAQFAKEVADVPDDAVPEDSPLFMGFKSGFRANQASESRVTIDEGPFAGGTTQHVSALDLNLKPWYTQDDEWQRVAKMFAPTHAEEGLVEGIGANLGADSAMDRALDPLEAARTFGVVGHSQKMLSARRDDEPVILRRDFDTTDGGDAGLHFLAVQETIEDFVTTRRAMNGADIAADTPIGQRLNNGILQYLRTTRRGNFLLPPRRHRALPAADP
ncbi:MAG: Tat pathway signal protein [Halobacteriales archaeon]|nr:Tat pathway signal protein [Halobacteriales archaeon]